MALDYEAACDAILTRFREAMNTGSPALNGTVPLALVFEPTEADLITHPKDSGIAWARAVVRHADSQKVTLKTNTNGARFRRTGLLWAQIFVPAHSAKDWTKAQRLAMVAQAGFEGKRTPGDGVLFLTSSIIEVPRDGAYFRFDLKVTFTWDEIH